MPDAQRKTSRKQRFLRWLTELALSVPASPTRSFLSKLMLFLGSGYVFLWVPDLDLLLLPLLHHRSIITHSILPGLLLIMLGRKHGAAPIAGALVGLSVHLTCDLLSPMEGFAQIWLPYPIKVPLGPLSYLWLAMNGFLGFMLASLVARTAFRGLSLPIVASAAALIGMSYGWINEDALISVILVLTMITLSLLPEFLLKRRRHRRRADAQGRGE